MTSQMLSERYQLLEVIGTGGMSIVYRAYDEKAKRDVAVKVLRSEYSSNEDFIRRFNHEALAASRMSHENIVSMLDVGRDGDTRFIVMEYVEGQTLKELIREKGRLRPIDAVSTMLSILAAIDHAHRNHIVHRDIKPQNILTGKNGKIKVADFGIARMTTAQTVTVMDPGTALGSVHYFSPEQAEGKVADEKSDLYSAGIVLYEMLAGHVPFDGDTPVAIALKHLNEEPASLYGSVEGISKGLNEVVLKSLSKDPARRYQSAAEMASDLKHALRNPQGGFVRYPPSPEEQAEIARIRRIKRRRRQKLMWVAVPLAIVMFAVIGIFGFIYLRNYVNQVEVPYVCGIPAETAYEQLHLWELNDVTEYEYSEVIPLNFVIRQDPAEGQVVQRGDPVKITVSLGSDPERKVMLDDLIGESAASAEQALLDAGFTDVSLEYEISEYSGRVIAQSPTAGEWKFDTPIVLTVGSRATTVPLLSGYTPEEAASMLAEAKLTPGSITESYSADAAGGTVIGQSMASGTEVPENTVIDLTVCPIREEVFYASFTISLPLDMNVRIALLTENGEREIVDALYRTGSYTFDIDSNKSGEQQISVTIDDDEPYTETLLFE